MDNLNSKKNIKTRGFEIVKREFVEGGNSVYMPERGTKTSAGYDFFATEELVIGPKCSHLVWTNIKAYMLPDEVLEIYPRSSIGIKKGLMLKNTVGIVDSDYYSNPKNDGNIGIVLYNFENTTCRIKEGEGIAQGIFKKFLESDNCNTDDERSGGIGSTS